jgi:hypothetical protein
MPFPLLPVALGICFAIVWMFIGAMLLRDSQFAVRRDRESRTVRLPKTRTRSRRAA